MLEVDASDVACLGSFIVWGLALKGLQNCNSLPGSTECSRSSSAVAGKTLETPRGIPLKMGF